MKPKTKMHYEIVSLSAKLPKISKTQIKWAYKQNFKFYAWKTKHKAVCFECGHAWDLERNLISTLFPIVCPACGKDLQQTDSHAWRKTECEYMEIMTTTGDYQVIRVIQLYHWMVKSVKAEYGWHELYQHWIHSSGKFNVMSTSFNSMGSYTQGGGWSWCGPMELRANQNDRYFINGIPTYPKISIHPYIIRNGWIKEFHGHNHGWFFSTLLSTPLFETFLKIGQYDLVKEFHHLNYIMKEFWPQIRICLKHNYRIENVINWADYLRLLKHFHKNIFDPLLVCPEDLGEAHDHIVNEKRMIDELNRKASEARIAQENIEFKKKKKKLMDLLFTDGEITIVPLKNITDFKKEEKALNHCVYSAEYHKKASSLIMSARKGEERLETIEISLREKRVMQCRGFDNQDSAYHKVILNLINKNLKHIKWDG